MSGRLEFKIDTDMSDTYAVPTPVGVHYPFVATTPSGGLVRLDTDGTSGWKWSYRSSDGDICVTSSDGFKWLENAKTEVQYFVDRFERND